MLIYYMRLVLMSDSHSLHNEFGFNIEDYINPKDENILVHSGDCTNMGTDKEIKDFIDWFSGIQMFDKKIFIAGNHDFGLENKNKISYHTSEVSKVSEMLEPNLLNKSNVIYLEDSEFIFKSVSLKRKLKFYGSPWQPEFFNWAFNLPIDGDQLKDKWNKIPKDTDVLITHGPPFGILDLTPDIRSVGCNLLRRRITDVKPLIHNFGHIHHSNGETFHNGTYFVNSSVCNEKYKPINEPKVIDLTLDKYGDILINGDTWN